MCKVSSCNMQQLVGHAGKEFKPVSGQQLLTAAAQLYTGSSPQQLANLELAMQGHFNAPSFAALGHGASLLQCCAEDPVMMQTMSLVFSTVPLSKVRASPLSALIPTLPAPWETLTCLLACCVVSCVGLLDHCPLHAGPPGVYVLLVACAVQYLQYIMLWLGFMYIM